jgi:hypothetical protein
MANHLTPSTPEREGLVRASHKDGSSPSADSGGEVHPVLTLQRQIGNAQIQRMLAQREAAPEEDEVQAKRDPSVVQREAAPEEEEVQAKRDPSLVQREAAPEEEEKAVQAKRDPTIQREPEVGLEGGPVSDGVQRRIESARGGGAPLDSGTRGAMEGSFGESFGDVRLHTDRESDSLSRSLGARAFTTGNDIFLRQDASPSDRSLLGHELAHVVQQRDGAVTSQGSGMQVGPADDAFERAADSAGSAVASGGAPAQAKRDET